MSRPILNRIVEHLRETVGAPDTAVTDAQLLERFLGSRDEVAFELLVRRHERLVFDVCRRVLRNPHDAEDAFQATFLVLIRKAGSIGRRAALAAWLHQVAYRVALRANCAAQKRAGRETTQVDPAGLPSREPDPADTSLRELGPLLDEELNRLPEKYRAAIALCHLQGCTYQEAAERLGVPRGTFSTWLTRARNLLRARLSRRGVVLSAAIALGLGKNVTAAPVAATVRAALAWAAEGAAACTVSTRAAILAEGVLRTMFLSKIQFATAALLAVVLVTGGGLLAFPSGTDGPPRPVVLPTPAGVPDTGGLPRDSGKAPAPLEGGGTAAFRQEAMRFEGHKGAVLTAVFAPDARRLATGGADGFVRVWDVSTGKEIMALRGDGEPICSVAFSPDGKLLATASVGKARVRIWELATGKLVREAGANDGLVNAAVFSPDGKLLVVGGSDKAVRALESATLKTVWSTATGARVAAVAFSPDGQRLAAVGGTIDPTDRRFLAGQPFVIDAATGKVILATTSQTSPRITVAFSPDGKLLASGGADREVRLQDVASGNEVRRLVGHAGAVTSVAFSPDARRLATGSADTTVRIWDVATGKPVENLTHSKPVAVVAFSPDGRWLLTASGAEVRLWAAAPDRGVAGKLPADGAAPVKDHLDTLLQDLLQRQRGDEGFVEALFLASLGRLPSDLERKFALGHVSKAKDRREAFADLLFQLTQTREFTEHVRALSERAKRRSGK
ncbi:MAG TPA: sigma-70 family RNA polymerase sigma factor [Gemmataceae bacterium]|nr:sigma-70 family RNA polymerase sigma factor [Gemmataceae bacterium]